MLEIQVVALTTVSCGISVRTHIGLPARSTTKDGEADQTCCRRTFFAETFNAASAIRIVGFRTIRYGARSSMHGGYQDGQAEPHEHFSFILLSLFVRIANCVWMGGIKPFCQLTHCKKMMKDPKRFYQKI